MTPRGISALAALVLVLAGCGGDQAGPGDGGAAGHPSQSLTALPSEAPGDDMGKAKEGDAGKRRGRSTESVEVVDTAFQPKDVTVAAGTEVEWNQTGLQPHSVTSSEGKFDSSPRCSPLRTEHCLGEGDDFSFVFDKPGSYSYYCRVHGLPDGTGMTGAIEVTE